MTHLELNFLGPFEATLDGEPVSGFASDKVRALLAYLAVEGRQPHRREALAGLLWPDYPDADALASLRQSIHRLRQALGEGTQAKLPPFLLVTPQTVRLEPDSYRLDVEEFSALLDACRSHRHRKIEYCSTCHARFLRAAQLYRGDILTGFLLQDSQAFDEWLVLKREGLRRQALDVFESLAMYFESRAEYGKALQYVYRQLEMEPWREEAHRQAMKLLAFDGQRSAAIAQYETCRRVLREEFGIEPEAQTTTLYESIKAGDQGSWILLTPASRHNLPQQLTPFIGREQELARINELLDSPDYRLVTLVGLGGVGKTRLALRAAYEQVGAFDDGVRYVPLAPVDRAELMASSIAQAVGLRFGAAEQPEAQLLDYLRDKEVLLVLDNFEHLLGGSPSYLRSRGSGVGGPRAQREPGLPADRSPTPDRPPLSLIPPTPADGTDLLVSILKNAPKTTMLVTSRERLGLQAEHLFDVSGLPVPSTHDGPLTADDSRGGSRTAPTTRTAPTSSILRKPRTHRPSSSYTPDAYTPDALAGLMGSSAVRLFVERAQRVQSEFALSADNAQGVLDICGLVEGLPLGIVLAAAWVRHFPTARIAKSISDNLDFLRSSSRDASAQHGSLRAVFNHSWNLLPEAEQQVLRKLSVFRGGWDEDAAEKVAGASVFSLSSLVDKSLLRRDASGRFSMHEVVRQYAAEQLQAVPGEQDETQAGHAIYFLDFAERAERELRGPDADAWLTALGREHDNFRAALRWAREGHERKRGAVRGEGLEAGNEGLTPNPSPLTPVEVGLRIAAALSGFWFVRGYYSEGWEQLERVLSLTRERSESEWPASEARTSDQSRQETPATRSRFARGPLTTATARAKALNGAGALACLKGDYTSAHSLYQESLAINRELGDERGIGQSLGNLGILAFYQGDYGAARSLYDESLAIHRELGDKIRIATALNNLGNVANAQGDHASARSIYEESLVLSRELGDQEGIAFALVNLGAVAYVQGDHASARSLYEEGLAIRRELGDQGGIAFALSSLGNVAYSQRDYDTARSRYKESLVMQRELGEKFGIVRCLAGLGALAAGIRGPLRGGHEQAQAQEQVRLGVKLLGASEALLEAIGAVMELDDRMVYEQGIASARAQLSEEEFERAWAEGRAMPWEQAIEYALEPTIGVAS